VPFDLTGKVAAVTGAGSGIGQAIAELFARQGARVYVLDVDADAGSRVAAQIARAGGTGTFLRCDVSSGSDVASCFDTLFERAGRLDILVNNAGVAHVGNVESTTEADLDRLYAINVKGVYHCLRAGIAKLKQSGGGAIVNMASIASVVGLADRFAYSMSKGAVLTMTLSVAADYLKDAIRCNCICPARVHTPFVDGFISRNYPGQEREIFEKLSRAQPIGRMGKPEEVAALALYLCSDEAAFATGGVYPIDGGATSLI
jgi:NAD(P)-dependent dehydrogenase (short-subunit alcohol dehydrogenase family)